MVALAPSSPQKSYAEPSPYAWLRSRTPVPTSYAPACEPLYPFQEILENRTSRARVMTCSCTEVVERKFAICIEIWQFELESCVWRVSFHKYAYVHGDPISMNDPTGEFGVLIGIGISMMMAGPGDYIKGGLEALVKSYVVNLEWDVQWALDMSQPDDWGSRLDDKWVYAALGQGLHDQFNIDTPFGTFNPLDLFGGSGDSADVSSFNARNTRIPDSVRFAGGHKAAYSDAWYMPYVKGATTLWGKVSRYFHPKLGRRIALFDDAMSPIGTIKIDYARLTTGQSWSVLTDAEKSAMRSKDFAKGREWLRKNGVAFTREGDNVVIDGVKYTWHHHHKKGHLQLIPRDVHEKIGHIGMAIWHQY